MSQLKNASWTRKVLGGFLIAVLATLHSGFLITNSSVSWVVFFAVLALVSYKSHGIKDTKGVKVFQFKTASILSFLLPVSSIVYMLVFTGKSVSSATSEAEQAGAAIGSVLGGGVLTFFTFIFGLSLGIVFYLLYKKSEK